MILNAKIGIIPFEKALFHYTLLPGKVKFGKTPFLVATVLTPSAVSQN